MVPAAYHTFFADSAEVAGTLIGLLFVAVSLAPDKLIGKTEVDFQVRSGVAFTALINALVVSLVALVPNADLGEAGIILAIGGASSTIGLGVISFRHATVGRRLRALLRVAVLMALFVVQFVGSVGLEIHPGGAGPVDTEAYLIVSSFAFAIERAWELVGASDSGVLPMLTRSFAERHTAQKQRFR